MDNKPGGLQDYRLPIDDNINVLPARGLRSNCLEFICTRPAMKIFVAAFAALVVSVSAAAVDKDKELDAAQDLIINLNKASTLDRK